MNVIKKLTEDDKTDYFELIKVIEEQLDNKLYWLPISAASKDHFFDDEWTTILGLYEDKKLIAASSLFYNSNEYGESASFLGLGPSAGKIAEIGRCMVLPDHRGGDYMLLLNERLLGIAKKMHIDTLIATAHPDNRGSCRSLEKLGMKKEGFVIKNGSYPRNIYAMSV